METNKESMEFKTPLWPIRVQRHCDEENCNGDMVFQSTVQESHLHRCYKCGIVKEFDKTYPYIEWTEFDGAIPDTVGMQYFTAVLIDLFDQRYLQKPPIYRQDLNQILKMFERIGVQVDEE